MLHRYNALNQLQRHITKAIFDNITWHAMESNELGTSIRTNIHDKTTEFPMRYLETKFPKLHVQI